MAKSYYPPLLEAGVKIYEYTPGFVHAKSYVCDDQIGTVGSINMDFRSLYLHFECGTMLYQCEACLLYTSTEEAAAEETTEEQPEETQEESVETGEAQAQNRETRVKESVNVRSDATTDSDRIALAYQGDAITEIESYDNGWSKVEYKGQTGYVKTEFLE